MSSRLPFVSRAPALQVGVGIDTIGARLGGLGPQIAQVIALGSVNHEVGHIHNAATRMVADPLTELGVLVLENDGIWHLGNRSSKAGNPTLAHQLRTLRGVRAPKI